MQLCGQSEASEVDLSWAASYTEGAWKSSILETLKNTCKQNRYLSDLSTKMLAASVCVNAG